MEDPKGRSQLQRIRVVRVSEGDGFRQKVNGFRNQACDDPLHPVDGPRSPITTSLAAASTLPAVAEAMLAAQAVTTYAPRSKAADEFRALARFIKSIKHSYAEGQLW